MTVALRHLHLHLLEMQNLIPTPDLLNQNLHFYKIPSQIKATVKSEAQLCRIFRDLSNCHIADTVASGHVWLFKFKSIRISQPSFS